MRVFFLLFIKELRSYFQSFIAYAVIAMSMLLHGLVFAYGIYLLRQAPSHGSLVHWSFNHLYFWLVFTLIVPLITMRLFAEEQKLGTLEPLLTAPVRNSQLVLAKFFSALALFVVLYLPCLLNFWIFQSISHEAAAYTSAGFAGAYIILIGMGMMFVALGCLTSALTSNQIVAAILCFTAMAIYLFLGYAKLIANDLGPMTLRFLAYISSMEHMRDFCNGFFDTRPLVYYLSFTVFFLFLTHQVLEYRKWKV